MRFKFEVIQKDIDKGLRCSSNGCPVALAIKRVIPNNHGVYVGYDMIKIYQNGLSIGATSKKIQTFISRFDGCGYKERRRLKPFMAVIDLK